MSPELVHAVAAWALGPHPILSAVALPLVLTTAALLLLALWVVQGDHLAVLAALRIGCGPSAQAATACTSSGLTTPPSPSPHPRAPAPPGASAAAR